MAALQTMPYMPPELLEHSQLTPAADTYSFGVIVWESFTGQASSHTDFTLCMGACCVCSRFQELLQA